MRALGLHTAVVMLTLGTAFGLVFGFVTGSAHAREAESGAEALGAEGTQLRDAKREAPTSSRRRARRDLQDQQRREWWAHAREVLFTDLELDAEQARGVDAIVETQLRNRARFEELDVQFAAALRRADKERTAALDAELRALDAQLKDQHELFEEMRALLTEEQRPIFDTNRARLVAEAQAARKAQREGGSAGRPERRMRMDAE
jgi:hypothetical protein